MYLLQNATSIYNSNLNNWMWGAKSRLAELQRLRQVSLGSLQTLQADAELAQLHQGQPERTLHISIVIPGEGGLVIPGEGGL